MKYYSNMLCKTWKLDSGEQSENKRTWRLASLAGRWLGLLMCRLPASDSVPEMEQRPHMGIGRTQARVVFLCYYLNSVSSWGLHMRLQINPFSSENLVLKNSCVSLLNSLIIYPPWYVKPFISVVNCQEYTELLRSCSKQYKHWIGHLKTPHGEPGSIVVPNVVGSM